MLIFLLVKPSQLSNCTIKAALNLSSEILEVECVPGYDGGIKQEFRLEAFDVSNGKMRLNASSASTETPIFRIAVADLLPATHFYLRVFAINAKGKSDPTLLEDILLRDSEKHPGRIFFISFFISQTHFFYPQIFDSSIFFIQNYNLFYF